MGSDQQVPDGLLEQDAAVVGVSQLAIEDHVVGIPSERWGESPLAVIIPAEGADPSEQDIIDHCAERLARFKLPKNVERVEAIPRNPSGKILKTELRKPYWAGQERAVN